MAAEASHEAAHDGSHFLDPGHLIGHVKDATYFELPRFLVVAGDDVAHGDRGKIKIPQFYEGKAIFAPNTDLIEPFDLKVTKFMVLEMVAAIILAFIAITFAKKVSGGKLATGRFWIAVETILLFLRDEVARPAIGKKDADRFLPYLWTVFFFVLICNLLGMLPWLGSPTGALATTGVLALMTFGCVVGAGSKEMGFVGFWKAQVPHMELPLLLAIFMKPGIFLIELMGIVIKHFVLAVRLLANMFAGHLVLGVLVAFIGVVAFEVTHYAHPLFLGVSIASILGATALGLLELFVAFLQAYIFTFLSALFIGMAVHPH